MKTHGVGKSHVGMKRSNNEDSFLVDDELGLYLVCDGLGGHAAGERASKIAVASCQATVRAQLAALGGLPSDGDHEHLRTIVLESVQEACRAVYDHATTHPDLAGMGCTLTLLLVSGARGVMAHVGDTRLYLMRDGATWQLSSDHTIAADLVRQGALTPEKLSGHRLSSALTRGIGTQPAVEPETLILDVLPSDVFLICSDGLSTYLDGLGELNRVLLGGDLQTVPQELIELANERGGRDNVTAVVVEALPTDEEDEQLLAMAGDLESREGALKAQPLFGELRFADRLRLIEVSECLRLGQDDVVFAAGDSLHGLYVVEEGELELETAGHPARVLARGASVGATSLLVPRTAPSTLRARGPAKVLLIRGEGFLRLARLRPWLGVAMMSALARELSVELSDAGDRILSTTSPAPRWWDPRRWL